MREYKLALRDGIGRAVLKQKTLAIHNMVAKYLGYERCADYLKALENGIGREVLKRAKTKTD